ncbi:MAG: ferritin [Desulfobacterales bacterium]|nr:ferritin [Desulfobacterales bacterium]
MIGKKLNDAMNDQIKNELESYYIYLSMAAYFHSKALDGMGHWMRVQAHEEMVHAMKFMNHLIDRGGKVMLKDLKQLKTSWKSPLEAFQDAYKHEQFITSKINALTTIARQEKEYASEPLLAWFSDEQIEEESNTSKIMEQIAMVHGADRDGRCGQVRPAHDGPRAGRARLPPRQPLRSRGDRGRRCRVKQLGPVSALSRTC